MKEAPYCHVSLDNLHRYQYLQGLGWQHSPDLSKSGHDRLLENPYGECLDSSTAFEAGLGSLLRRWSADLDFTSVAQIGLGDATIHGPEDRFEFWTLRAGKAADDIRLFRGPSVDAMTEQDASGEVLLCEGGVELVLSMLKKEHSRVLEGPSPVELDF
jgi:hypothetical protein